MKIILGNDHANIEYVFSIKSYLEEQGFEVEHLGTYTSESVDYPDYGEKVARQVVFAKDDQVKGIVICGTGIGISIAANKVRGAICANCCTVQMGVLAREHNNANILALGARTLSLQEGKDIVDAFFSTPFGGDRHARRVDKIMKIES